MLMKELGAEGGVAEGCDATGAKGGEGSGDVPEGCGTEGIAAVEVGVEEAGVEAVAGADGVGGVDGEWGDGVALGAALDDGTAGAALDDDEGDAIGEGIECLSEGGLIGDLEELIVVGQEDIDFVEEGVEETAGSGGPEVSWVVIGVE